MCQAGAGRWHVGRKVGYNQGLERTKIEALAAPRCIVNSSKGCHGFVLPESGATSLLFYNAVLQQFLCWSRLVKPAAHKACVLLVLSQQNSSPACPYPHLAAPPSLQVDLLMCPECTGGHLLRAFCTGGCFERRSNACGEQCRRGGTASYKYFMKLGRGRRGEGSIVRKAQISADNPGYGMADLSFA
eukprot:1157497-Pelagomonas_calceolata.AAC.4